MQLRSTVPALAAAVLLAACATEAPNPAAAPLVKAATTGADDPAVVSPFLGVMNAKLARANSKMRVAKAELIVNPATWNGSSQTLIANDRARGVGYRWVKGDPRRDGRTGVTYTFDSRNAKTAIRNADGTLQLVTAPEFETYLEEGMAAWRGRSCSNAPITKVALPANTDPDLLDNLFLGFDGGRELAQVSDIVQAGWQPRAFFNAFAGPDGDNIIGVSFTFVFVDEADNPTDIDKDGNADIALNEVYYNTAFVWSGQGAAGTVDFYSIIAHETGHSFGLAHFGKVFVTKRAAADGITIADVKYAPKALMNAVYVTGRNEITGTDNSSFCQIWASK